MYILDNFDNYVFFILIKKSVRTPKVVRDAIESCTGSGGVNVEDNRDYCVGWIPKKQNLQNDPNCTEIPEYQ